MIVDSKGKPNDLIQILKSEMEEAEGVMLVGWHNETVEEDMCRRLETDDWNYPTIRGGS